MPVSGASVIARSCMKLARCSSSAASPRLSCVFLWSCCGACRVFYKCPSTRQIANGNRLTYNRIASPGLWNRSAAAYQLITYISMYCDCRNTFHVHMRCKSSQVMKPVRVVSDEHTQLVPQYLKWSISGSTAQANENKFFCRGVDMVL